MTGRVAGVKRRLSKRCRPGLEHIEPRMLLSTFTVANTNNDGPGSLRQAILDADGHAGADVIDFSIGGGGQQTIALTSSLPEITDTVTIDGATQPGFNGKPLVVLDGSAIHTGGSGLVLSGGSSTIQGLVIDHFGLGAGGSGIWIKGGGGNLILGNYIGVDPTGSSGAGNTYAGVWVTDSSSNTIGDGSAVGRNVISGNGLYGVRIEGQQTGATRNEIAGNYIGTNAAGTQAVGNGLDGVSIWRASNNAIGQHFIVLPVDPLDAIGDAFRFATDPNVISGNGRDGVSIGSNGMMPASGNLVTINLIGTDVSGSNALGNGRNGVYLFNANNNTVGTGNFSSNTISGNGANGVEITGPLAVGNQVTGNMIGMNEAGTGGLGNQQSGVLIESASYNSIGNVLTGPPGSLNQFPSNVISANHGNGITIEGGPGHNNAVLANLIGTERSGLHGFGNGGNGVAIIDSSSNFIGSGFQIMRFDANPLLLSPTGPMFFASNLISANARDGILISGLGAFGNRFGDDVIGESTTGAALGNGGHGVVFTQGASHNVFTSNLLPNGSIVAYNGQGGIEIQSGHNNTIDRTSSFLNGGVGTPGIVLDNGANDNAPAPVIRQAYFTPLGNYVAIGSLHGQPNSTYSIELYYKQEIRDGGTPWFGDQRLAASMTVHTDAFGNASFRFDFKPPALRPSDLVLPPPPSGGAVIEPLRVTNTTVSATATQISPTANQLMGSTSEFSNDEPVANVEAEPGSLQLSMTQSPQTVYAGQQITYTINVTNGGPTPLTNVHVFAPVPAGTSLVSITGRTPSLVIFSADPNNIQLGTLPAHGSAVIQLVVRAVVPNFHVTAEAFVSSDQPDPYIGDNAAVLHTLVHNTPGVVGFAQPRLVVSENAGAATLTLTRSFGDLGTVDVPFTIADGSAHLGVDYGGPGSGVVRFADGQTTATLTIPIIDRHLVDGAIRSLTVTLGKPSSGWVSTSTTATLFIVDPRPQPVPTSRPMVAMSLRGRP